MKQKYLIKRQTNIDVPCLDIISLQNANISITE